MSQEQMSQEQMSTLPLYSSRTTLPPAAVAATATVMAVSASDPVVTAAVPVLMAYAMRQFLYSLQSPWNLPADQIGLTPAE
jgi:hypothetical protein